MKLELLQMRLCAPEEGKQGSSHMSHESHVHIGL